MIAQELEKIVGGANAADSPAALAEFSADSPVSPSLKPAGIVRPENVEQVQAIVKWANETGSPLIPVSSGAPHYRGDTAPGKSGAVIVDLSRMNKIVRVDTRNKVALIEPGVTFGELQPELEKAGLCAYMPLAPRANKSVVASVLERDPIMMASHHWDSTDPLLCAEAVFGTGDKFRTGEASGPESTEEQWNWGRVQMNPFGHSHVDFQRLLSGAQGTIGIVTWASLKCCYLSEVTHACFAPSENIDPLIDLIYQAAKFRVGGKLFILDGLNLACLLGKNANEILKLKQGLPPWVLFISFEGYGILPKDKIDFEEADFKEMAKSVNLSTAEKIGDAKAVDLAQLLTRPSAAPYWKTRLKGGFRDIFFLTTLDRVNEFTASINYLAGQEDYPADSIGVYVQPIVHGTSCHCEFDVFYNPENAAETQAAGNLISLAAEKIAGLGGFFSRPYGDWKAAAYRGADGTLNMQKKIKAIFDPKGILNPGKLGF